ncbi:UAA transporter family protein [Acanthamoeba castellanii str. Neff]|uniref:UAA transporter family protein n=1 Tax=Acanthamoeba castellanii (strain ATCC 30010 / Neff) TaxID=1257118 RepID=L8GI39_ACACF|nr:UAA transporter family protein [Acanthamoeba castellanii str. Neff]ELR12745.1 UAA transporter family protein [Acanthamoeba castellanii str. Neff]
MDVGLKEKQPQALSLLGIPVGHLPQFVQLLICVGGVFFFHICHGYLQEAIFKVPGYKYGLFLTLFELLAFMLFSVSSVNVFSNERRTPLRYYFILSLLLLLTTGLGNASLGYLNYPTKVILRSAKVIPAMLCGLLVIQKRLTNARSSYTLAEYCGAALVSAGLALFTLADSQLSPNFNVIGLAMVMTSVLSEALLSNFQEKILKNFGSPQSEMVFYSNFVGFVQILAVTIFSGELVTAMEFCMQNKGTLGLVMMEATMGYFGVYFYLAIIKRKVVTLVLSFIIFPKPFTWLYLLSGIMVFSGFGLNTYVNNAQWIHDKLQAWLEQRKGINQEEWE